MFIFNWDMRKPVRCSEVSGVSGPERPAPNVARAVCLEVHLMCCFSCFCSVTQSSSRVSTERNREGNWGPRGVRCRLSPVLFAALCSCASLCLDFQSLDFIWLNFRSNKSPISFMGERRTSYWCQLLGYLWRGKGLCVRQLSMQSLH